MDISIIRIELTNACDLCCNHCLRDSGTTTAYLPIKSILQIIKQAKIYNIKNVSLTGGEPTLHPEFEKVLEMFADAGYALRLVTNGNNFYRVYKKIIKFKDSIKNIRFSLDGAEEITHDKNRGNGSYQRVMEAIRICQREKFPFSLNTVITRFNKEELEKITKLAYKLKSTSLFFSHFQFATQVMHNRLGISFAECLSAENKIYRLQDMYALKLKIELCAGYYIRNPIYLCRVPLNGFNIDYKGNITYCIQLSSLKIRLNNKEVIGNLKDITLPEARNKLKTMYVLFGKKKIHDIMEGRFNKSDHFSCRNCLRYFKEFNE